MLIKKKVTLLKKAEYVAVLRYWINFRYYVIEMHGKFYLIDYANPLDPRSYFSGLFPRYNKYYTLYDITDRLSDYPLKDLPWWQSSTPQALEMLIVFVVFLVGALHAIFVRIGWWFFQNEGMIHHWQLILLLFFLGFVLIVIYLYKETRINLTLSGKTCRVKRTPRIKQGRKKNKNKVPSVREFFTTLIGLPATLLFTLTNNYIINLIGFIMLYYVIFYRYTSLYLLLQDHKFVIVPDKGR